MKELWVEKYRPKTIDGYVWRDDALERNALRYRSCTTTRTDDPTLQP